MFGDQKLRWNCLVTKVSLESFGDCKYHWNCLATCYGDINHHQNCLATLSICWNYILTTNYRSNSIVESMGELSTAVSQQLYRRNITAQVCLCEHGGTLHCCIAATLSQKHHHKSGVSVSMGELSTAHPDGSKQVSWSSQMGNNNKKSTGLFSPP